MWQVKWKGYDQATWEPAESFVGDIQLDWLRYNKKHKIVVDVTRFPDTS